MAILRNAYGSSRYMNFLSGLGELIRLRDCSLSEVYTGGLDRNGADGEHAYNWRSEIAQSNDYVMLAFWLFIFAIICLSSRLFWCSFVFYMCVFCCFCLPHAFSFLLFWFIVLFCCVRSFVCFFLCWSACYFIVCSSSFSMVLIRTLST